MTIENPKMNRRNFLRLAGKSAVSAGIFLSGCAQTSMQPAGKGVGAQLKAIDIHHHYFAPELIDEIKQHGKALGIEYIPPKESRDSPLSIKFPGGNRLNMDRRLAEVEKRLSIMTEGKVAIASAEVQTSAVGYELDGQRGESWSRLYNEAIHSLVKRHPDRFM